MKAALLVDKNSISLEEIPTPEIDDDSALIKVRSCGICGSDIRFFRYGDRIESFPAILGHEISGEVVEVGRGVTNLRVGDRVVLGSEIPCGQCEPCRRGFVTLCEHVLSIGTTVWGGFSEYMLLSEPMVKRGPIVKIPQSLEFDDAALAENLACVVNAMEFVNMSEGKRVLVIGTGPVGCAMISVSRVLGASMVVAAETDPDRLSIARAFEADHYLDAGDGDFINQALDITDGRGFDAVISACSNPEAHERAIILAGKGGIVNLFGGIRGSTSDVISFPHNFVHYRCITIGGTFSSTQNHLAKAVELLASGKINTESLITHKLQLQGIKQGLEIVGRRQGLKVMINP